MEGYFLRRHPYPRLIPRSTLPALRPDAYGAYDPYRYELVGIPPLGARPVYRYPALDVIPSASQLESVTPWEAFFQSQARRLSRAGLGKALQNLRPVKKRFKVSQIQQRKVLKAIGSTVPEGKEINGGKRFEVVRKPLSRRQTGTIKGRIGPRTHTHQKGSTKGEFSKKFSQRNANIKKGQSSGHDRRGSLKYDPIDLAAQVRALHDLWWNGPGSGTVSVEDLQIPLLRPQPKRKEATRKYETVPDSTLKIAQVRALHDLWWNGPGAGIVSVEDIQTPLLRPELKGKDCTRKYETVRGSTLKNRCGQRNKSPRILAIEKDAVQSPLEIHEVGSKKFHKRKNKKHRLPIAEEKANNTAAWWPLVGSTTGANMPCDDVIANENDGFGLNVLVKEEEVDLDVPIVVQSDACKIVVDFLSHVDVELESLTAEEDKEREEEGFLFFSSLFEENPELKSYYVDNCNGGMFDCLICHSIGEKKSFDKLLSLVMHATSRVKRRPEHRGYGRAVCSVLGWSASKI